MPRNPRSAEKLIAELDALVPDLKVEQDDLDGLGVYRTYRLTSETHKGLPDVINAVADRRIVNSKAISNGVEVTFTHFVSADKVDPFRVDHAADLLSKKKPAKKAAAPPPQDED